MFKDLNNYHPKLNFTVEVNPVKFLDTRLEFVDGTAVTSVNIKETKLPIPWSSKVPKRYKRNTITGDLHRAQRIGSNFQREINNIKTKYRKADYPPRYVNSVVAQFTNKKDEFDDSLLIPANFYEEAKQFLLIEIPFCERNEKLSKSFINKFHKYTDSSYRLSIKWLTKKVKTLFPLKDKNEHLACKIYEGVCICGQNYVGETKRNVEQRWKEHLPPHNSEPAKHLVENPTHYFQWRVISDAPKNKRERKNLEALFIARKRPSLNEQLETQLLLLFRFGIT